MLSLKQCIAFALGVLGMASPALAQHQSTYRYDALGRLVGDIKADTSTSTAGGRLAFYAYDGGGNRTLHQAYTVAARAAPNMLLPDEVLLPNQSVVSDDGETRLAFLGDGSLVITCNNAVQLVLQPSNGEAAQLIMQGQGNLVLYSYVPTAMWYTGVGGYPGAFLAAQNDGNVVIYHGSTPIWASWTFC